MVNKLDKQTYTSEFESHWVPHLYGLAPHQNKNLSKLQLCRQEVFWARINFKLMKYAFFQNNLVRIIISDSKPFNYVQTKDYY